MAETPKQGRGHSAPNAPARRRPALIDVANAAGVSHMTVSRVMNDAYGVKAETRERVMAAVRELGYRPNTLARALVTGRTQTFGVVCSDMTLYGPASTLHGIEQASRDQDFFVSIVSLRSINRHSVREAIEHLYRQAVDGIIVVAPHVAVAGALKFVPKDVPLVVVEGGEIDGFPVVNVDQFEGAKKATELLLSLGHPNVWHIAGPSDWIVAHDRERAWAETLQAAGITPPPVVRGDWSARSGYELGLKLADDRDVSAIFVANDQMALGLLRALYEHDVRVPEDVSVVAFDDIPEAAYTTPPLSTVRQDFIEVGRRTVGLLLQSLDSGPVEPDRIVVAPELVDRQSTGRFAQR